LTWHCHAPAVTEIASYDQLRQALNQRRVELGMSFEDLDARSGLADRYTTKLLSASPSAHGCYHRNIGPAAMDACCPLSKYASGLSRSTTNCRHRAT
jgi:hypothetical protein